MEYKMWLGKAISIAGAEQHGGPLQDSVWDRHHDCHVQVEQVSQHQNQESLQAGNSIKQPQAHMRERTAEEQERGFESPLEGWDHIYLDKQEALRGLRLWDY